MLTHTETIKRVIGVTTETSESGYFLLCIEVVTAGNVRKVLKVPHASADMLRVGLVGEFDAMDDEQRRRSFNASITRG